MNTTHDQIKIAVTNLGMYTEGALCFRWLSLPAEQNEITTVLKQIGVDGVRYEEYCITDAEGLGFMDGSDIMYGNIDVINQIAEAIEQNNVVKAVLEHEGWHYWRENIEGLVAHANEAILLDDIYTHEALGYWLVENGYVTVPDELVFYFNYESYGNDFDINNPGGFISGGYLLV